MVANPIPPRDPETVIMDLLEHDAVPIGEVIERSGEQGFDRDLIRQVIWQLLSDGRIDLSSDRKLEIRHLHEERQAR
jgi:hypothetical protein